MTTIAQQLPQASIKATIRDHVDFTDSMPLAWSDWYLTDEADMGASCEQHLIIQALLSYLHSLVRERAWQHVFIGSDQFFAWVKQEPLVRVSPDVYLLDTPLPQPLPASWQTWLPGHQPPRLAFEIVSHGKGGVGVSLTSPSWQKDYFEVPHKYAQLGTQELVIFDPEAVRMPANKWLSRSPLQVFALNNQHKLVSTYTGTGPAYCSNLDAWLVVLPGQVNTLGIARDSAGTSMVPSVEQARTMLEQACLSEQVLRKQEQMLRKQEQKARQKAEYAQKQEAEARRYAEIKLAEALAKIERLKPKL